MINHVNLALYLVCHHGNPDEALKDARVIQRVSVEKGVPITYFFSGIELKALYENRERIHNELWMDLVGAIQSGVFINPRMRDSSPYKPELGIMPFHHIPLVQPWAEHLCAEYFEGFLKDEIRLSRCLAEQCFRKTPVTISPPDGVYAPAAAHCLREQGLDTVLVSGEFLGENRHAKGMLYWGSGLRHLMRTNDLQPQSPGFCHANDFVDAVLDYANRHDISSVVASCDIDEFNGMRGLTLNDGIARLCCIGDEVYRRPGISMVNCNAAAHSNPKQDNIEHVWPLNDIHASIHGKGDIDWIDSKRNEVVGYLIHLVGERYRQGWDVCAAKKHLCMALDIALRNCYFCYDSALSCYFKENVAEANRLLHGEASECRIWSL